jgi:hypothetical protein
VAAEFIQVKQMSGRLPAPPQQIPFPASCREFFALFQDIGFIFGFQIGIGGMATTSSIPNKDLEIKNRGAMKDLLPFFSLFGFRN